MGGVSPFLSTRGDETLPDIVRTNGGPNDGTDPAPEGRISAGAGGIGIR